MTVANTTSSDELNGKSHYGAKSVDIAAPGTDIYSTIPTNSYKVMSGTSMSTPMVTSTVAVMRAINPNISAKEIKETLCSSSDKLSALTGKVISGGRLNAYNAVKAIMPTATPTATPTAAPTVTPMPTVLMNNKIECGIKDNKLIVSLNFEEDDEVMYVAFRKGNELKKIVTPDIHNMTAEVDLSDTEYDSIDVYVWNGNMKPYAEVKQIEK